MSDDAFSSKALGEGIVIYPVENKVYQTGNAGCSFDNRRFRSVFFRAG